MQPIILDTSVLVAIFMETEENHQHAKKLGDYLVDKNIWSNFPMHGFFELSSALKHKGIKGTFKLHEGFPEEKPFGLKFINIDQKFFEEYHDLSLPYIKGGDMIFLSMDKKDNAILITEDDKLHKRAIEAGIEVYKVKPFLEKYIDASN